MNGSLDQILRGYLDLRWQMNPVEGTYHGQRAMDGMLAQYDPDSIRAFLGALRSYESALEQVDAAELTDEIDRTAALHAVRHDILVLDRERPFSFNPAFHLNHALSGLFLLLVRARQEPARGHAILERLRELPPFLERAAAALTEPDATLTGMGRAMIRGGLVLVREGLDDPTVDLTMIDPLELEEARTQAAEALEDFDETLDKLSARATDRFAIGRDLFDRKLHTAHMIRENADELLRFGERLRQQARAEVERLAKVIDPTAPWPDVIARLREDVPPRDEVVEEHAQAIDAARRFTIAHDLVPIPEAELCVVPTPEFMRPLVPFAAYTGPGALDELQRGHFFVTLPPPGQAYRAHCRAELGATSLHEGIPGHHLQIVTGNGLARVSRRVLGTPAAREGWALYCESLMDELGFYDTPAQRLFQAHHLLWRALRVVIDVSLHTRGMRVQEATRLLQDELGFEKPNAEAEATRYCAYPTYQLCYAVGRRDILRLRQDAQQSAGERFTLRRFHEDLLSYGAYPIPLARWGMGLDESNARD